MTADITAISPKEIAVLALMLFMSAIFDEECRVVKRILYDYEKAAGLAVNLAKSGILMSNNVSMARKEEISSIFEVWQPLNTGRYLGLPSLIGRNKRAIFNYLRDRMWKRVQGWSGKAISKAGKEVLIKAAAQAIPVFCMSAFLLPISLAEELQRMLNSFWWGSKKDGARSLNWMRWDLLCKRKEDGGLGFRKFFDFNLAMLGKQGWKFISNPDAFVCKILKAKYFPQGDFLNATLGQNPSFTWRSVWSSQVLLQKGVRWKISDGASVQVWKDPWLRNPDNFLIQSPQSDGLQNLRVQELMIPGCNLWDIDLIEELFCSEDVATITSIPLTGCPGPDRRIWHFTKNGNYSVKSGYRVAMDFEQDRNISANEKWKRLWRIWVPPKAKNFLWRLGRGCLPTRENLSKRGVQVSLSCVLRESGIENSWHVLINCPFAESCWQEAGLHESIYSAADNSESVVEWLFKVLDKLSKTGIDKFTMTAWAIWKQRNNKLWNSSHLPARDTVVAALNVLYEWLAVKAQKTEEVERTQNKLQCELWHPPPLSFVKCNIDVALPYETGVTGLGMVLRGDFGAFIGCRSSLIQGRLPVIEGEAMSLLEAMRWVGNLGFQKVVFESDSKGMVEAFGNSETGMSELASIIAQCRLLMAAKPDFSVRFVSRKGNEIAHLLARNAYCYASPCSWVEAPSFVVDLLSRFCTQLDHISIIN